ncbi:unnamed protein product [Closterium sp. NIES-54]
MSGSPRSNNGSSVTSPSRPTASPAADNSHLQQQQQQHQYQHQPMYGMPLSSQPVHTTTAAASSTAAAATAATAASTAAAAVPGSSSQPGQQSNFVSTGPYQYQRAYQPANLQQRVNAAVLSLNQMFPTPMSIDGSSYQRGQMPQGSDGSNNSFSFGPAGQGQQTQQGSQAPSLYQLQAADGPNTWYLDSCCGQHLCSSETRFIMNQRRLENPVVVTVANNQRLTAHWMGSIVLDSVEEDFSLHLNEVLLVPRLGFNLMSSAQLMKNGITLLGEPGKFTLKYGEKKLGTAVEQNGVFVLNFIPERTTPDSDNILSLGPWEHCDDIDYTDDTVPREGVVPTSSTTAVAVMLTFDDQGLNDVENSRQYMAAVAGWGDTTMPTDGGVWGADAPDETTWGETPAERATRLLAEAEQRVAEMEILDSGRLVGVEPVPAASDQESGELVLAPGEYVDVEVRVPPPYLTCYVAPAFDQIRSDGHQLLLSFFANAEYYLRAQGHKATAETWHKRLGHPSQSTLNNTIKAAYRPPTAPLGKFDQRANRLLVPARDCIFYENLTLPVFEQHLASQQNPATLFHGVRSFANADVELAASEEPDSDGAREAAPDPPVPVTSSGIPEFIPLTDAAPEDVREVHHTYLVDDQRQPMPVVSDSSIRVNLDEIGGASGDHSDSVNFAGRTDDNPHYQTGLQILGLAAAVQYSSTINLEPKTARQALSGPHREKWREAMDRELAAL